MNYIDVARMMKQAVSITLPPGYEHIKINGPISTNDWNNLVQPVDWDAWYAKFYAGEQQRQANLQQAAQARQQEAANRRAQQQATAQANENAFNNFRAQFQAQNKARADRYNNIITNQQKRDAAWRQNQLATNQPQAKPQAEPPASRPTITPSSTATVFNNSGINPKSGVRLADNGRTILGAKTNATGSTMPAGWKQGWKDTHTGEWHKIA